MGVDIVSPGRAIQVRRAARQSLVSILRRVMSAEAVEGATPAEERIAEAEWERIARMVEGLDAMDRL